MDFEAAALFGVDDDLKFVHVSAGELRPDEVLVRMVAAGICHTDLTVLKGRFPAPLPIILGHEGSGVVEKTGGAVSDLAPGDHVALSFMSCGHCESCGDGRPAYCRSFAALNLTGVREDGSTCLHCAGDAVGGHFFGQSSFARYSVAHRRNVVKVRSDAPLEMIAPFGCGIQTGAGAIFNSLRPKPGSSCIVFGAGGVGLSAIMAAKVLACAPIIVVEPRPARRALALQLGATLAIDPASEDDLAARLIAATDGGARAIVDTTGMSGIIDTAISALGHGGKLGLIGMHDMEARAGFVIMGLLSKGASIQGIIEGDSDPQRFIPYLVDLFLEGRFPVDRLISFFDFADINAAMAAQMDGSVIKPVLRF